MWMRVAKRLGALAFLILLMFSGPVACNRADGESGESDTPTSQNGENEDGDKDSPSGDAENGEEDEEDQEDEAVPVEMVTVGRGRIESILRFSTNLEAESEVQVFSEAARKVTALLVEEGNLVRKGQVLIRLQSEAQQTELARVQSQLGNARQEHQRQTNLYNQQLISVEDFNEASYQLDQLELSLQDAERELGYTQVRAPISGTITERFVNVGDHLTVNQHLFDIIDFDSIVARVYVPEKELSRLEVGQDARIFADAAGANERHGAVDRIAPRIDPRSGTVKTTVSIPPSEGLLPGMYVTVELITSIHEDAVLVPKKALVYDADQLFIFRLKDDETVERLLIRATLEDRDYIEPEGILQEGDQIVVAGQASLKDGSKVRLVGADSDQDDAEESAE